MTVSDWMTRAVVMVDSEERMDIAQMLMMLVASRHIPVVDRGGLVGVISLRDLLAAGLPAFRSTSVERREHLKTVKARQVMSRTPVVARPFDSLASAAAQLVTHRISCLPVIDEDDALVGMLTSTDLTRYAIRCLEREAAATGVVPTVSRLMTPAPLASIQKSERLDAARMYMQYEQCRHLPVLDGERLVGILSDRDVLAALRSRLEELSLAERLHDACGIVVGAIMTPEPDTTTALAPAADAARRLVDRNVGALPVVDGNRLVGIVTETDFLAYVGGIERTETRTEAAS